MSRCASLQQDLRSAWSRTSGLGILLQETWTLKVPQRKPVGCGTGGLSGFHSTGVGERQSWTVPIPTFSRGPTRPRPGTHVVWACQASWGAPCAWATRVGLVIAPVGVWPVERVISSRLLARAASSSPSRSANCRRCSAVCCSSSVTRRCSRSTQHRGFGHLKRPPFAIAKAQSILNFPSWE
jgi:hypothetical protein